METLTVDKWLYAKLTGDATLMALVQAVYNTRVPQDAPLPYVLFREQTARDVRGMGPVRIWADTRFLVRVVAETRSWLGSLETAANRIDVLLDCASGTVTGGQVFVCVREEPFRLVESVQSREWRHLGGVYRMLAR